MKIARYQRYLLRARLNDFMRDIQRSIFDALINQAVVPSLATVKIAVPVPVSYVSISVFVET
jgi:hypothetical protein